MRPTVEFGDVEALLEEELKAQSVATTAAMIEATDGLVGELRGQILAAGLGNRLAYTVRGRTYPVGGHSVEPAGYVWTKAPKLIDVFARGATIYPVNGARYLAIPTDNVPPKLRSGRGGLKRMTPLDVEVAFNQDLIIRPGKRGHKLAFVDVLQAKNGRGFRQATSRRLAQGRQRKLVLMFTLVPQVTIRKRLDLDGAADRWAGRVPDLITKHWR